jgi:hypothetical protein
MLVLNAQEMKSPANSRLRILFFFMISCLSENAVCQETQVMFLGIGGKLINGQTGRERAGLWFTIVSGRRTPRKWMKAWSQPGEGCASEGADCQANRGAYPRIPGGVVVTQGHNYQGSLLHEILWHLWHGLGSTPHNWFSIERLVTTPARKPSAGAMPGPSRPAGRIRGSRVLLLFRQPSSVSAVYRRLHLCALPADHEQCMIGNRVEATG